MRSGPSVHPDDHERMRRAGQGDAAAFAGIYQQYFPIVRDFIVSRNGHHDSIEDLAQEVFRRAWKNAKSFREQSSLKTFLLGMAVNVLHEERRSRVSVRPRPGQAAQPPSSCPWCLEPCTLSEVEAVACRKERTAAVARQIAALPKPWRKAVELVFIRGLATSEAAKTANCTSRVLRYRLAQAIAAMSEVLHSGNDRSANLKNTFCKTSAPQET